VARYRQIGPDHPVYTEKDGLPRRGVNDA